MHIMRVGCVHVFVFDILWDILHEHHWFGILHHVLVKNLLFETILQQAWKRKGCQSHENSWNDSSIGLSF
jgi:hypothetical protein